VLNHRNVCDLPEYYAILQQHTAALVSLDIILLLHILCITVDELLLLSESGCKGPLLLHGCYLPAGCREHAEAVQDVRGVFVARASVQEWGRIFKWDFIINIINKSPICDCSILCQPLALSR
jgi:hypothetical protein